MITHLMEYIFYVFFQQNVLCPELNHVANPQKGVSLQPRTFALSHDIAYDHPGRPRIAIVSNRSSTIGGFFARRHIPCNCSSGSRIDA